MVYFVTDKRVVIVGSFAESFLDFRGNLTRLLIQEGCEVHVCLPTCAHDVAAAIKLLGVELHHYPIKRAGKNPFTDIMTVLALRTLLLNIKPTHLIAYTIKPVTYANLALRLARLSTRSFALITGLGYLFTSASTKVSIIRQLITPLYRYSLKRCEKVIFQNNDDLQLFVQLGIADVKKSVKVAGSGVDVDHYRLAPLPDKPVFLMIARLVKDKGVMEYFAAAALMKQQYPEAHFMLAGFLDSNPTSLSEHELNQGLAGSNMEFLGRLEDVREAISRCSVYVLPSYREGTPRTVLEAMSMGRAVITTDTPGCRETVNDGVNGYLVSVKSSQDLAEAMKTLINNPDKIQRMGKASSTLVSEVFCDKRVNGALVRLVL